MLAGQDETPLADAVDATLADTALTAFSTPGHKRSAEFDDPLLRVDLPLAAGADDLHLGQDVLGRAERLAALLWGADLCHFCLNGSTQGNQTLALAAGAPGRRLIVTRGLHRSLLAGIVLAGLEPVWVSPGIDPRTGLPLGVPAGQVEEALAQHPDACGVFLVEANYVGARSDVESIAASCRAAGVPLLVDQAWGAYLGFHPALPAHALEAGANALVTSAHKTLTGFTQTAYLLARGGALDIRRIRDSFDALATTSPSATMLASLDRSRRLLATRGPELLDRALRLAGAARERLVGIEGIAIPDGPPGQRDPLKLVIGLAGTGADGMAVERDLVRAGIRLELANRDTLVPLVTIADTEATVERLVEALSAAVQRHRGEPRDPSASSLLWSIEPRTALSPRDAFFAPRETVSADRADGRICAETVSPYPPGIPVLAPGEVVTRGVVAALREAVASGTRLTGCADPALETLQVVV